MEKPLRLPPAIERQLQAVALEVQQQDDPAWVSAQVIGYVIDDARTHMSVADVIESVRGALSIPPDETVVD